MKRTWFALLALALLVPATASAQSPPAGVAWGPRIGLSSSPDQFLIGGQVDFGDVAENLAIVPNVELGFGDDDETFALNADFHYRFRLSGTSWRPYAGAGFGLLLADGDVEAGGALIFGATAPFRSSSRFFGEFKLGLADAADFKFLVGWNFQ